MSSSERSFPIAFRLLAAVIALAVAVWLVPAVARAADDPPSEQDVQDARGQKRQLLADLGTMQGELAAVQARLVEASAAVEEQEELLVEVEADLLATQQRIQDNRARYERLTARLNDRVAEAFIQGPGSSLEFLLGAQTMSELTDRLAYVDAVARADADLAQQAENIRNRLLVDEAALEDLRAEREQQLARTQAQAEQVRADLARQEELTAAIEGKVGEAEEYAKQLAADRREFLRELARQQAQAAASGGHAAVPMPAGFENVFQVCPVDAPRGFGDGFGAPRYVGGYHPHRGVDIVAPEGTPVRSPFDGVARDATNLYGGTSVIVDGQYGYVYNAHLRSIAKLGPVSAGDVIGYVSSTGLAGGSTPHDHFEFWPRVIPSGWPTSYYGYSVIDGAINPYPLLVAVCG
jgi:murein DD-endopeptidase MepM/ murein hydrolase activator NlpD